VLDAQAAQRLGIVKKSARGPAIVSDSGNPVLFYQSDQAGVLTNINTATFTEMARLTTVGLSIQTGANPTAILHLKAGTTSANTAPLKFTTGTNLTAAEAGAMEWDGINL